MLQDAACHLKQLEQYMPWSNAVKREIKEHKKDAGCKLLQSRAWKNLWDDCLELDTAHDIYKLNGEVPKTMISGEISDISQFWELELFKWVIFWDEPAQFPDDMLK